MIIENDKNVVLVINSLNVRGFRGSKKRKAVFKQLKQNYIGITLFQETHTSINDEKNGLKNGEQTSYLIMVVLIHVVLQFYSAKIMTAT